MRRSLKRSPTKRHPGTRTQGNVQSLRLRQTAAAQHNKDHARRATRLRSQTTINRSKFRRRAAEAAFEKERAERLERARRKRKAEERRKVCCGVGFPLLVVPAQGYPIVLLHAKFGTNSQAIHNKLLLKAKRSHP